MVRFLDNRAEHGILSNRVKGRGKNLLVHPSPSQRLSLRGMSPSGAEPEPAATPPSPIKGEGMNKDSFDRSR